MTCPDCERTPTWGQCGAEAAWWHIERGKVFVCTLLPRHARAHHGQGLRWWTWGNGRTLKVLCARHQKTKNV